MNKLIYLLGEYETITTAFEGLLEAVREGNVSEDSAGLLDSVFSPVIEKAKATIEAAKQQLDN